MKTKLYFLLAVFSSFSILGFGTANATLNQSTEQSSQQQTRGGEIAAVLIAVDSNEIAAAHLALKKSTNPLVKKFANQMITDHGRNLKNVVTLTKTLKVAPIETDVSKGLVEAGKQEAATLNTLEAQEFDTAYINAMVKGHTEVLDLIDQRLKDATNPKIKKLLERTRQLVSHHLDEAKTIQTKLASNS